MPKDTTAPFGSIVHYRLRFAWRKLVQQGKFSRSRPLYPRFHFWSHDLSPPRCPPFLEAGTWDLLWLYKSQRKASERREDWGGSKAKKKTQGRNRGPSKKKTEQKYRVKRHKFTERRREKGGATHRRISLVIVFVPAEKEEPEVNKKLRESQHIHYLLS